MKTIFPLLAAGLAVMTAPVALAQAPDVKAGVDAWSGGNYDSAVRIWQPLADRGDADALFNLAQAYKLGRGVPLDLTRAEDLYGKAAAKGHLQAADAYGLLLFQRGERQRALPYIEGSASRGDPRAQYILGVAYFNGDIVRKDWVRAYALATLAQQAGLEQATSALAQMDQHIPLADRQKSVVLAQQIAAQAQANRQRLNASAELGTPPARPPLAASAVPEREVVEARHAVAQAAHAAGTDSTAPKTTDFARPWKSAAPGPAPARTEANRPEANRPEARTPPPAPKPAPKPAAAVASGPWRVQLGAFGVAGNAEALWARIKGRPELAGHPRALVPAGKLTKLQATGFASKAEADAACARLTAGGFGCLAARD
ncbi:SPOR domain-containing protein [Novosphingobium resinovorum]|uniref:SPOR domain-containing protein n=1 Tax=Novosphingobium resinovorum TaxID=158500 RepID=UPI002ED310A6|nr:SPOR domain-containing protein [Novosphingobium resinovorum]